MRDVCETTPRFIVFTIDDVKWIRFFALDDVKRSRFGALNDAMRFEERVMVGSTVEKAGRMRAAKRAHSPAGAPYFAEIGAPRRRIGDSQ